MKTNRNRITQRGTINHALTASVQKIKEIGNRQYKQAMIHMNTFKKYEERNRSREEVVDPQCTFKPIIFTSKYREKHKNHNQTCLADRLIQWGNSKEKKRLLKAVKSQVQFNKQANFLGFKSSIEKKQKNGATYLKKYNIKKAQTQPQTCVTSPKNNTTYTNFFEKKNSLINIQQSTNNLLQQ